MYDKNISGYENVIKSQLIVDQQTNKLIMKSRRIKVFLLRKTFWKELIFLFYYRYTEWAMEFEHYKR